jgi:hypothetical protein
VARNSGSAVPVKVQLVNAAGTNLSAAGDQGHRDRCERVASVGPEQPGVAASLGSDVGLALARGRHIEERENLLGCEMSALERAFDPE